MRVLLTTGKAFRASLPQEVVFWCPPRPGMSPESQRCRCVVQRLGGMSTVQL